MSSIRIKQLARSATSTPELSASQRSSPALQQVQTPEEELPSFVLGAAALSGGRPRLPECWAHRGNSNKYPENTKASFIEACELGVDGIETDLHITTDNVVLCFHDPELDTKTDGKGKIELQAWRGHLEHVRTKQAPVQPLPFLSDVLEVMLYPGNEAVKLNLDCKVGIDPERLFVLIQGVLTTFDDWEKRLAPRIILGLWHPKFLLPAARHLPYLPRYAISMTLADAKRYFWNSVHGFSMYYEGLATREGQLFIAECKAEGRSVCAWTVNTKEGMRECARWGIASCITDRPDRWREVAAEFEADYEGAMKPTLQTFLLPWLSRTAYSFDIAREAKDDKEYLEREGGRFEDWGDVQTGLQIAGAE
ncbi:PLC-like phosphodiesterase [Dioszegia hungarica]|uniref:PLC-like phosphodiesterase n=1 Tax=Dioszegia hungarica TaxID=4972 RepID=A0AA38LUY8_9TREE|nr:PLC-like phosphodiesterase [Dioszegia hungarica]KAI9636540.1 PLC-like phosphodiesterase [Dioszegia hungarica]